MNPRVKALVDSGLSRMAANKRFKQEQKIKGIAQASQDVRGFLPNRQTQQWVNTPNNREMSPAKAGIRNSIYAAARGRVEAMDIMESFRR